MDQEIEGMHSWIHRHAHRGGLDRSATGVVLHRVVAKERHVRGVAAGVHARRRYAHEADRALTRQVVHHRCARRLERGATVELVERINPRSGSS